MLEILNCTKGDFFLLDDKTEPFNFNLLKEFVQNYYRRVEVIDLEQLSNELLAAYRYFCWESNTIIVALGEGGCRILDFWPQNICMPHIERCKWSRVWDSDYKTHFQHSLDTIDLENKQIVVFEDVIASGETLRALKNYLVARNASIIKVFAIAISGTSPIILNQLSLDILTAIKLASDFRSETKDGFSAHWYPGIYSLRHLLHGDTENPQFYKVLSDFYFNGIDVKPIIQKARG